jgi:hypothetical protein
LIFSYYKHKIDFVQNIPISSLNDLGTSLLILDQRITVAYPVLLELGMKLVDELACGGERGVGDHKYVAFDFGDVQTHCD